MLNIPFAFVSLFIAWIWVDYFRLIDVYNKNKLGPIIIMFALGYASVFLVYGTHQFADGIFGFSPGHGFVDSLFYYVFDVAMIEELAKVLPFLIMVILFKNEFKEPIDYIAFISISALGFSAMENYMYFEKSGATIIDTRSILCSVGHMFDTALTGYGIVLFIYHPRIKSIFIIPAFFGLAVISHGIYDTIIDVFNSPLLTILYFLITISWYSIIINNSLNNSSFFDYKKSIDPSQVVDNLMIYYVVVIGIQLIILATTESVDFAVKNLLSTSLVTFPIILITCTRLSRFKLIYQHWHPFNIELPVTLGGKGGGLLRIKGGGHEEALMAKYFQEFAWLYPINQNRSNFGPKTLIFIEDVDFLHNEEVFYQIKVFSSDKNSSFIRLLIKPSQKGKKLVSNEFPIVSVLDHRKCDDWHDKKLKVGDFPFIERAYIILADNI